MPAADGKMRFWRNTAIATQAAGATATLPNGTLGYEWDSDLDNGARPAGAFQLSSTTLAGADVLQDYGSTYNTDTAAHNMTLYKAASGARVFGAGTVQWSWGLDANHDRGTAAANVSMQQATVNLFADMGSQPSTLMSGLTAATPSADAAAPSSTITAPAPNSSITPGSQVTVSGTATDTGGGVVGGVEVSTDGGTTWHRASGRGTWTYTWAAGSSGTYTLRSRAADDSGNLESPAAGVTVTVGSGNQSCPCTIWPPNATPALASENDTNAVEVGVKFRSDTDGRITGIRFYKGSANTGTHVGHLWTRTGTLLASATFTNESATRLAAGQLLDAGRDHRQHHLRRLLPRPERPLRRQRGLLRADRRRLAAAARPQGRHRRRQRPLRLRPERHVPDRRLPHRELLGRRRVRHRLRRRRRWGRHHAADGHLDLARRGRRAASASTPT